MTFKIDMDGVIRDILTPMLEIYNKEYNESLTLDDITDYDVDKVFTKCMEVDGKSAVDFFFKEHSKEIFLDSKPYDGVDKAIKLFRKYGDKVIIVTWQFTLQNKLYVLDFLEKHGIEYDDICFTKDKWRIEADYIIDDNPHFLNDEREKAIPIKVKQPYNKFAKGIGCYSLYELSPQETHSYLLGMWRNRYRTFSTTTGGEVPVMCKEDDYLFYSDL